MFNNWHHQCCGAAFRFTNVARDGMSFQVKEHEGVYIVYVSDEGSGLALREPFRAASEEEAETFVQTFVR